MLTEQELKLQLSDIAKNEYRLPDGVDHWRLALDMLSHLGTPDPELRDDLIYTTFIKWARQGRFSPDQFRTLLATALDNDHLFFGLGERDTDSVFMRAFSLLVIVLPLYYHRRTPFLSATEVRAAHRKVIDYLGQEQDLRGYVEGKGWAHATAHAADVLDELAECAEIDRQGLLDILDAIRAKMTTPDAIFVHEEDERMAYATLSLLQRQLLAEAEIADWIKRFAPIEKTGDGRDRYRLVNVKTYLRSLYFQARHRRIAEHVCQPIDDTLRAISRFK